MGARKEGQEKIITSREEHDQFLRAIDPDLFRLQRMLLQELEESDKLGAHERALLRGFNPVIDELADYMHDILDMDVLLKEDE